jgi:hypothetical protein
MVAEPIDLRRQDESLSNAPRLELTLTVELAPPSLQPSEKDRGVRGDK